MKWSYRIATVSGIEVYFHLSGIALLIFCVCIFLDGGISGMVFGLAVGVGLVLTLIAHELGHSLVARRYGIGTYRVMVTAVGAIAHLTSMSRKPQIEIAIAVAGPLVSVLISLVLGGAGLTALWLTGSGFPPVIEMSVPHYLLSMAVVAGLTAVSNLLPAFPMDGGRIMRALLALKIDYRKATHLAMGVAILLSVLGVAWGFYSTNPFLIFTSGFVIVGAFVEGKV